MIITIMQFGPELIGMSCVSRKSGEMMNLPLASSLAVLVVVASCYARVITFKVDAFSVSIAPFRSARRNK